jgi:predicted MFS family arabinose efflux permease
MRDASPDRLRSQPGYPAFLGAATLGRLADEMLPVTVVLFVLDRTGRPGLAGLTVAAAAFPSVLTGPLLGVWLDGTSRRRTALAANSAILAVCLTGMFLAGGRAPDWVLPVLAALGGATAPLLTGGVSSVIPLLVPAPLLPRANALEAGSFNLAAILGPGLAGVAASVAGPGGALLAQTAVAVAALVAFTLLPPLPAPPAGARRPLGATLRAGLGQLLRSPVLRGVTVTTTLALGVQGLLPLALPLFTERLGAGRGGAGFLWAALEAGALAGALVAARIGAGWRPELVVLGGTALTGCAVAALALAGSFPVALAVMTLAGLAAGPAFASLFTVRQEWSPPELRGQIFTTAASAKIAAFAVGSALAGPVAGAIGVGATIAVTGAGQLLAVLAGLAAGAARRG